MNRRNTCKNSFILSHSSFYEEAIHASRHLVTEQAWIADNALFLRSIGRCLGGSNDFLAGLFAGRDVAQVEFIVVVDKCRL